MDHKKNPSFESTSAMDPNSSRPYSQPNSENPVFPRFPPSSSTPPTMDWDPRVMLSNLSYLEQKICQAQEIVRSIIENEGRHSLRPDELTAQQQLVNADLTCIVIQLISMAGTFLPCMRNTMLCNGAPFGPLASLIGSASSSGSGVASQQNKVDFPSEEGIVNPEYEELFKSPGEVEGIEPVLVEDQDVKDSEDGGVDGENLPPGSYEVLQLEKEEILAPHTHFCAICGKGFKRDANLRMHMRGHGDEYKTPAALAKPPKESSSEPLMIKRYSCPCRGCKRNKEHRNFQPLKTILCVKNHYKRTHCEKSYTCSRCNAKKFSVIADLKTHEKHCGRDKWLCSCGTTFSRKDKLFGHIALFQGHTPALPSDDIKVAGRSGQGASNEEMAKLANHDDDLLDIKGLDSPMNLDSFGFGGLDEFPRPVFDPSECSFPFFSSWSCDYARKHGDA